MGRSTQKSSLFSPREETGGTFTKMRLGMINMSPGSKMQANLQGLTLNMNEFLKDHQSHMIDDRQTATIFGHS